MPRRRPESLETALVLIELLKRIPRNGNVTAGELYEQLEVTDFKRSKRTIERYLKKLSEIDEFGIEYDPSRRPYEYHWRSATGGISLPALTEQESLLLALAEAQLKPLLPADLMRSMEGFFNQARTNLMTNGTGPGGSAAREWLGKVRVVSTTQPLLPAEIQPGVFEAVSNALYKNHWLELDYKNSADKQAKIRVMPLGLAQQGPSLYLVCRYDGYENERILAMHRILSARVSTLSFERPKEFDLERYSDEGHFGFGEGKQIRLNLRITKRAGKHLLETKLSIDQITKSINEKEYEISATVVDSMLLDRWLRGFLDDLTQITKSEIKN